MLWVIVGLVVLGAVFVVGTLLGSSLTRSAASDRARLAARDRRGVADTVTWSAPAPADRGPLTPRGTRTGRAARTLFDG